MSKPSSTTSDLLEALKAAIPLQPEITGSSDGLQVSIPSDLLEAAQTDPTGSSSQVLPTSGFIVQAWQCPLTGDWEGSSTAVPKDVMAFIAALQSSMGNVRAVAVLSQMLEVFQVLHNDPFVTLQLFTDGTLYRIGEALKGRAVTTDPNLISPAAEGIH